MIRIKNDRDCCGCEACDNSCPKKCISFLINEEGFYYPQIDMSICVNCGLCEKVCPWLHPGVKKDADELKIFQNDNSEILYNSSSGGAFFVLAKSILDQGGVVFGVRMDESNTAIHAMAENEEGLKCFMGSKYVQSRIGDTMKQCQNILKSGRKVLFSGTPCQIAGLKNFLKKDWDNLVTVDFICHGTPSPGIWKKHCEEKNIGDGTKSRFRDKRNGWRNFGLSYIDTKERKCYFGLNDDSYMKGFLGNLYLRASCYDCKAKSFSSGSDITMGDAWGIWEEGITDDRGVSLLVANTSKGHEMIERLNVLDIKLDADFLHKHNPAAYTSVPKTSKRKKFYKKIKGGSTVSQAVNHCFPPDTYLDKVMWSVKKRLRKYGLIK